MTRADKLAAAFVLAVFVVLVLVATRALHGFPHSADEWDSLFQARLFEHLQLKGPPLPTWTRPTGLRWLPPHIISGSGGVFSKYPPGWPALLAIGDALRAPAIVNPVLGSVLLGVTYVLVRRASDAKSALVAIALMATSSFFVINASSFYSHVLVALLVMIVLDAVHRYVSNDVPRTRYVVIAGAALLVLALTRPFDAALLVPALVVAGIGAHRRFGRLCARDGALVLVLLAATATAVLGYNAATTSKALLFGHQAYLADHDLATQFRPASGAVLVQAILEWEKVALPIWIAIALAVWLVARPGPLSRGVMIVGLVAAAAPWVAYSFRPPPTEIHYGPRYELVSLPIAAAFVGIALTRIRSLPLFLLATLLPIAWQVTVTGRHVRDLSITLYRGQGVERTKRALGEAIAPDRAVLVATGPAGSLPAIDLVRNEDIDAQVLVGAGFLRHRVDRMQHRRTFVWDGLPGLPMAWSIAGNDDVAHVVLTEPITVARKHGIGGTSGWLVTWNRTSCAAADSRRPPPGSGVSMPGTRPEIDSAFGPCPGEASGVDTTVRGTFTTSTAQGGPISLQLRAFVVADTPGSYVVTATSNGVIAARQIIIGDHDRLALNGDLAATPASIAMNVTGEGVGTFIGIAAYRLDGDVELTISLPPGLWAYSQMFAK